MNRSSGLYWGIVLILLGLFFLLDNLDLLSVGDAFRDYWPVLLVLWGAWMIGGGPSAKRKVAAGSPGKKGEEHWIDHSGSNIFGDIREQTQAETVTQSTVFGDVDVSVRSPNFRGGLLSTVFGDCTCDLVHSSVSPGEQVLRATTVFGDIYVSPPEGVPHALAAHTLFGKIRAGGDIRDGFSTSLIVQDQSYPDAGSKLRLEVSTVFGDIRMGA